MGSAACTGTDVSTNSATNALRTPHLKDGNILDDICENGLVLSPEMARAKGVSKATAQRCISMLSSY